MYLSWSLHEGRPSYRESFQHSKENIQHFKTNTFPNFRVIFPRSGSALPLRISIQPTNINADPDTKPNSEIKKLLWLRLWRNQIPKENDAEKKLYWFAPLDPCSSVCGWARRAGTAVAQSAWSARRRAGGRRPAPPYGSRPNSSTLSESEELESGITNLKNNSKIKLVSMVRYTFRCRSGSDIFLCSQTRAGSSYHKLVQVNKRQI